MSDILVLFAVTYLLLGMGLALVSANDIDWENEHFKGMRILSIIAVVPIFPAVVFARILLKLEKRL